MAEDRRAQLEQWRLARRRVATTSVPVQRRVVRRVAQTSQRAAATPELDTSRESDAADKPRKEKRRTSFVLPSPSNVPALAGGAKRVLTPTKPGGEPAPRATMESSDDDDVASDGGLGPSPRKRRAVAVGSSERVAASVEAAGEDDESARASDGGETDADSRTTLSLGAIAGPLRVLHASSGEEEEEEEEEQPRESESQTLPVNETSPSRDEPTTTTTTIEAAPPRENPSEAPQAAAVPASAAPQRVAVRVPTTTTSSLAPPQRRTSTGEARKSLDDTRPVRSLQERLDEHRKWDMEDFVVTKSLGKGKFGNVYLAKEKHSNVSVALKVLYKSPLVLDGGLKNLQREVEIQHRLLHPNLLRMFGYFYDEACVYLILEFAPHGELYKLLSKERRFSEALAAHYIAQVVDALEYLHGCHVIHRDIKPENLLMGPNHTIKLADFGWSVHAPQQFAKRRTFCGTPDYLSPEMLLNEEYDHRVDVWSVGVLAYEFLYGTTPFHVENQMEMYKRIENVDFKFPSDPHVSESAKRFILSLLKRNPADRMTLAQARDHEWLSQRPSI